MNDPATPSRGALVLRAVVGIVAFGLLGFSFTQILALLAYGGAQAIGGGVAAWVKDPNTGQIFLGGVVTALGFLGSTLVVGMLAFRLKPAELRWRNAGGAGRGITFAFLIGIALSGLILVLSAAFGGARWSPDNGTAMLYAERIGLVLLILAPSALAEELVFRGVPLVLLDRAAGRGAAIGITALLFALAHSQNPEITTLSIGNICVAGVLLGIAFYAPGGLWSAIGFHLGWNWAIASLDAPLSGIDLRIPFINYDPGGPAWLTGGKFGPEGGVLATLVLAMATVLASRLVLNQQKLKMED
ncbi:MAG: type II CAAX endopeptidase family protein [Gemmatimonadota bacterium]